MGHELIQLIEHMSKERGIPKALLLETLESALLSAAKKRYGNRPNINIRIDPTTGKVNLIVNKRIVQKVVDPKNEISLEEAKKIDNTKGIDEEIETYTDMHDFGRIAAQTAKQVILQKVKEAERDVIYSEYKDKAGQIVSGVVMQKEKGNYFVNLGKTEAVLPQRQTLPNESLRRGDTIRAYIEEVKATLRGPVIILSRTHPNFVAELFRMEVPEIYEGIVAIKGIVREAGERTKLTVMSKDPMVDPVGACVGMKGTRVQTIVRELKGERIDIIPWTEDPRMLIAKALSPASVEKIGVNEEEKSAVVVVNEQQLSLAIGKKGQNVRLAMKLTGWDIDIISESEYEKIKHEDTERHLQETIIKQGQKGQP